jgi:hypothetical protein
LFNYHKKGSFTLKPGIVRVSIGEAIPYDDYQMLSVEALRDRLFAAIRALSEPGNPGWHAGLRPGGR